MSEKQIIIVGNGVFGKALAAVYNSSSEVSFISRNHEQNIILPAATDTQPRYIFLTIPSHVIEDFCLQNHNKIGKNDWLIICAKGLTKEGKLLSEAAQNFIAKDQIAILSGPNFAVEITAQLPAIASLASTNGQLAKLLSTDNFSLLHCDDIVGIQLYGALKNVLAILCGIAYELKLGENFKAALLTKGIKEIAEFANAYGGKSEVIFEPGAIGDVFLTCNSLTSRNMKLGSLIARTGQYDPSILQDHSEGVLTIHSLSKILPRLSLPLPIIRYISEIINDNKLVDVVTLKKIVLERE